jgi:hypothetical protein
MFAAYGAGSKPVDRAQNQTSVAPNLVANQPVYAKSLYPASSAIWPNKFDPFVQAGSVNTFCSPDGVEIGAYLAADPPTATAVRDFENLSGRHVCSVMWYQSWDASYQPPFPNLDDLLYHDDYNTHTVPHLTWEPWVKLKDIANGKYDSYLRSYADQVGIWDRTIRLRFAHEMIQDDNYCWGQPGCPEWYPWQDQPADYIAAFRHVHGIFAARAPKVEFVWCPNNYPDRMDIVQKYYPGEEYVDWLCMDGYNPTNQDGLPGWPDWKWFDDIFYNIYHTLADNNDFFGDKPMMLGEFGSCEAGPYELPSETKSAWITNTFERLKSSDYAQVKAFYWFNIDKECDWRINSSSQSLSALQAAISDHNNFNSHHLLISGNTGVAGVALSYVDGTPKNVKSDALGNYSITVPYGWNGTIEASHACYTFGPANRPYTDLTANQPGQDFARTLVPASGCAEVGVYIGGGALKGIYGIPPKTAIVESYGGVNNGPVQISSNTAANIISSQRVTWGTGFDELMGYPANQLTNEYVFPWYNNKAMSSQLRIGNTGTVAADVDVYIGGTKMNTTPYNIAVGGSQRVEYAGINAGPVRVVTTTSGATILTTMRVIWGSGYDELMGYPANRLTNEYVFPWYNNKAMSSQLRIGNTGGVAADVDVYIGGTKMNTTPYNIAVGGSQRVEYAGVNNGPVRVVTTTSGATILATMRVLWGTGYDELMGYPADQLTDEYVFPMYTSTSLDTQLRIGNTGNVAASVDVYLGNTKLNNPAYNIAVGGSLRLNYAGKNAGPLRVVTTTPGASILATERLIKGSGYDELMGYPADRLTNEYLFPWYNNKAMNSEILIGVP